ncbi:type II toxin-antitoxin system RelE family toxin [Bifidobacterium cuniculi]|uniref:Cytotoxic translational repressor of toxin-antitoxin stability system n=1 Tax=Bifidobacterium cuniculi TaxID=1688 RepID=A0A087AII2_9BIFI|nr:type II toxin-antitoxin system RelE/ParE family toxin [Bifidobacterium cuniculi]KFI58582.1 Cytotoxic translational repressor of toxin-antitoxin stability system [Bifidobacterium cuniculi]
MSWTVRYLRQAERDVSRLREPTKSHVFKAIEKVAQNPLPQAEGGCGKPLGDKRGNNLTGLMKVKLHGDGIRIVYQLQRSERGMTVIVVGVRDDEAAYCL